MIQKLTPLVVNWFMPWTGLLCFLPLTCKKTVGVPYTSKVQTRPITLMSSYGLAGLFFFLVVSWPKWQQTTILFLNSLLKNQASLLNPNQASLVNPIWELMRIKEYWFSWCHPIPCCRVLALEMARMLCFIISNELKQHTPSRSWENLGEKVWTHARSLYARRSWCPGYVLYDDRSIELHAPTNSTQKLKLIGKGGQFTYTPTRRI
jgi:hypothetical protein